MKRQTKKQQQQQKIKQQQKQRLLNPEMIVQIDPAEAKRRAAAARAYALNSHTAEQHKTPNAQPSRRSNIQSNKKFKPTTTTNANNGSGGKNTVGNVIGHKLNFSPNINTIRTGNANANASAHTTDKNNNYKSNQIPPTHPSRMTTTGTTNKRKNTKAVRKLDPAAATSAMMNSSNTSGAGGSNVGAYNYGNHYHHQQQQQNMIQQQMLQQQQQEQHMRFINEISSKIDDEEYIKFVQGLWNTNISHENNTNNLKNDGLKMNNSTLIHKRNNAVKGDIIMSGDASANNMDCINTNISQNSDNNNDNGNNGEQNNREEKINKQNKDDEDDDDDDDEEYYNQGDDDDDDENDDYDGDEDSNHKSQQVQKDENSAIRITTINSSTIPNATNTTTNISSSNNSNIVDSIDELDDFDFDHEALEQELGSLLEEDMEAAVNSLLLNHELTKSSVGKKQTSGSSGSTSSSVLLPSLGSLPATPQTENKSTGGANISPEMMSTPLSKNHMSSINNQNTRSVAGDVHSPFTMTSSSPMTELASPSKKSTIPISPSKTTTSILTSSSTTSSTPATTTTTTASHPMPTDEQVLKLQKLMTDHYQVLLQQAVLAIRAAHSNKFNKDGGGGGGGGGGGATSTAVSHNINNSPHHYVRYGQQGNMNSVGGNVMAGLPYQNGMYQPYVGKRSRYHDFFFCGETADDLSMILDGAVTMLQDLDENRKDAIRYSIQMSHTRRKKRKLDYSTVDRNSGHVIYSTAHASQPTMGNDNGSSVVTNNCSNNDDDDDDDFEEERVRLTRSAFSRTLQENKWGGEGIMEYEDANQKSNHSSGTGGYSNSALGLGANTTFGVKGLARLDQTFTAIDNSLNAAVGGDGFGGIGIFDEADVSNKRGSYNMNSTNYFLKLSSSTIMSAFLFLFTAWSCL